MTETEQGLARQIAAHPEWQWMNGIRLLYVGPHRLGLDEKRVDNGDRKEPREGWIPDLSDPATQGCILSMIGDVKIDACSPWVQWRNADGSFSSAYSATLGEALARAWLAVKGKEPKP